MKLGLRKRPMTYHILKIESDSFEAIRGGGKQFEIRFNDRDY